MPRQSQLSQLSPTFPQVWIEPVGNTVYNLSFSGDYSPLPVPKVGQIVPYPHQWTSCGQLSVLGERPTTVWGEVTLKLWTILPKCPVIHTPLSFIPQSSPGSVDDPTPDDRRKHSSSPVSTGPTTTTTSITHDGINSLRVMQQSSPHLPVLMSKGKNSENPS